MKIDIDRVLDEIGDRIIQELQYKLEENKPGRSYNSMYTGQLYGSFEKSIKDNILSITTDKKYAEYLDEGRGPGRVNNYAIFEWVQARQIRGRDYRGRYQSYKQAAIAISKYIKRNGTEATNFVSRSFLKVTDFIEDIVAERYAQAIEKRIEPGLKLR